MEKEKEKNVRKYLESKNFTIEQSDLVINMIDQAQVKLIEDILKALEKKKLKIKDE